MGLAVGLTGLRVAVIGFLAGEIGRSFGTVLTGRRVGEKGWRVGNTGRLVGFGVDLGLGTGLTGLLGFGFGFAIGLTGEMGFRVDVIGFWIGGLRTTGGLRATVGGLLCGAIGASVRCSGACRTINDGGGGGACKRPAGFVGGLLHADD